MQSYLKDREQFTPGTKSTPARQAISPLAKVSLSKSGSSSHKEHGCPEVKCIKHGDRVTRIIVTCSCGEVIEIDCVYPDPA